jgi:hypothetical protein
LHTEGQKLQRASAILRHKRIATNLKNEYEVLAYQLRDAETDEDVPRSEREKVSDRIIARMTMLKHEIDIREELLQWL